MKTVKKVIFLSIVLALLMMLVSCIKPPIGNGENNNGNGDDVDNTQSDETPQGNINDNDNVDKASWDADKVYDLDKPKATIETYASTEDATVYSFKNMKNEDALDYIEYLKDEGYTYNSVTLKDYTYGASNEEGVHVAFYYDAETGYGTITISKGDAPDPSDDGGAVIGGDNEWDSSKVAGIPDPGSEILSFWNTDKSVQYTFEPLEDYTDFVNKIKAAGFTINPTEAVISGSFMYVASNSKGDVVTFTAAEDEWVLGVVLAE